MQMYQGATASPGLVMGPVRRLQHSGPGLERVVQTPGREQALLNAAVVLAKDELRLLEEAAVGTDKDIFLFQQVMLDDPGLNREIASYIAAGAGAAPAVERAAQLYAGRIEAADDDYIRQRAMDVLDACRRVVNILDGRPRTPLRLETPSILVSEYIYPSDIVSIGRGMLLGVACAEGSEQSHASIIARTMGIPAVVQLGAGFLSQNCAAGAVLDADNGRLILEPDEAVRKDAQRRIVGASILKKRLAALGAAGPCRTKDGAHVALMASCSGPEDVELAMQAGAEGVGLLRSEFSIMAGRIPSEEEQYYFYLSCLQAAGGKPVTVRTFDIGADKSVPGLTEDSPNPALGMRGLRMSLAHPQMFEEQLCALLRAGARGPLRVAIPMVSCPEDWQRAMHHVEKARRTLRRRGVVFNEEMEFGCMVETPSAALLAGDILAAGCRFLVVGTNDLVQYTYAADRLDGRFSDFFSARSPAVHRLVGMVLEAAAGTGAPVCICGVHAGSPNQVVRYARQGVRCFSTEAASLLQVKARLLEEDLTAPETD
ncbi:MULTISPECIES: phosphoenolpyruvate--protein phosphotransferase [Allofournierella]|uniref:phosphoenolpyruvate--protein phosphotransferase n=1 Tax=Allofournierella TaxID=1940255 RepID=UPI002E7683B3|nr:putative PEP-binding protein [Fournierella sp.]MEE0755679.1 putative PEP-binding protein [Fournierella sp.]